MALHAEDSKTPTPPDVRRQPSQRCSRREVYPASAGIGGIGRAAVAHALARSAAYAPEKVKEVTGEEIEEAVGCVWRRSDRMVLMFWNRDTTTLNSVFLRVTHNDDLE